MNESRYYYCRRCGHLGARMLHLRGGQAVTDTCGVCGSYDIEPCNELPDGARKVPIGVLKSAESTAIYWKCRAEALASIVHEAIDNNSLSAPYAVQAQRAMAGMV